MTAVALTIESLWRYPVKSMGGEQIDSAMVVAGGIAGDRSFAVIEAATGNVASAKNPRKWGALLECSAAYVAGPDGPAVITLPSGDEVRTDDPEVDARLSDSLGVDATLASLPDSTGKYEADWPAGVAPDEFLDVTRTGPGEDGGTMTSLSTRPASYLDFAAVHLLAASTLDHLSQLAPQSAFDVRRYRPNLVIGGAEPGFVENGWTSALRVGPEVVLQPIVATMRCIMTTLAQHGLPRDPGTLRAVSTHNRIAIPGFGTWSCVGLYADVATPGAVSVGDTFVIS